MAALHDTQGFECGKRRVARRLQRGLDRGERLGPLLEPRPLGAQGFIRLSDGLHHAVEIRGIEVARNEAERFQRLQQRRQHGHDVVHHGLTHRTLSLLPLIVSGYTDVGDCLQGFSSNLNPGYIELAIPIDSSRLVSKGVRKIWNGIAAQCSRGAFRSFARSIELSTTSKVTPSW